MCKYFYVEEVEAQCVVMLLLLPHSQSSQRHHVKTVLFNYVASCIEEAHYSPTLPLSENLTFDSSSAKSTVDMVLKVESGSDCHHYSVTGSNPRYLTLTPLISVYPLVQIPTPQADGGIPYWRTSESSFMGMDHEASPMLLKPTPVVTYSISKAQSIPLLTFTSPAIFSISFCSLLIQCISSEGGILLKS